MKAVETLSIFICIFLITWSAGDGAPQWRPQGRFGKRFTNTRTAHDLMTALQTVAQDDDQYGQMYMDDQNFQLVDTDTVEELYSNSPSAMTSSSSSSSSLSSKWPFIGSRICIETSFPGVFRCHRLSMQIHRLTTKQWRRCHDNQTASSRVMVNITITETAYRNMFLAQCLKKKHVYSCTLCNDERRGRSGSSVVTVQDE